MAQKKAVSKHSRAARRATAVDIDTDKSLKDVAPPKRTKERPSVLAAHQTAGVAKKQRQSRRTKLSSKARKRHEKGLEMAEAVSERTDKKKEKSLGKARLIQGRAKGWEDINKEALAEGGEADEDEDEVAGGARTGGVAKLGDEAGETDEEMEAGPEGKPALAAGPVASESKLDDDDDDDEIL